MFSVYVEGNLPLLIFLLQQRRHLTKKVSPLLKQNCKPLKFSQICVLGKDLKWGRFGNSGPMVSSQLKLGSPSQP